MKAQNYSGVWIVAESAEGKIKAVSFELLSRGKTLADKRKTTLTAVVLGWNIADDALQELIDCGTDRVIVMQTPQLEHFLPEPHAACMMELIKKYRPEIIIAAATSTGRTLMPYMAVRANAGLTADCTVLDIEPESGNLLQTRPAIGGNILATIKTPCHRPQMATVRPHSTKPAPKMTGRMGKIIRIAAPKHCLKSRIRRANFAANKDEQPLQNAETIVSVGRGIKKADNLKVVQPLCRQLGVSLGATRDVVDRGWLSYPHQIGLSGKTVSPRLYVAVGVSGSIQHLAGMQTAETIVAINSDPEAQIFKVADFGIVGNLFGVVPAIIKEISKLKEK